MNGYERFVDTDTEISLEGPDSVNEVDISQLSRASPQIDDRPLPVDGDIGLDVISYSKTASEGRNGITEHSVDLGSFTEGGDAPQTGLRCVQHRLRPVLEHLSFRIITVLLVVLDLILVIVDLAKKDRDRPLEVASLVIMSYFLVECSLRLLAQGPRVFVKHWIEVLDAVIIIVSFVFAILPIALSHLGTNVAFIRLLVAGRLVRIILIIRLISEKKNLEKATRKVVSQNKRRYQKDGFDLDLCYITERVIAMSFPSSGFMAFYRNPIKDVARFLDQTHGDHYKVFNLCGERTYDESMFHNQVTRYRIDDHNVPKLWELLDFAQTAAAWLEKDKDNVIAVHCKGGKGRTGTIICTWLVESGAFEEAKESLDFFGDRRTDLSVGSKFQGVETPSQSRYVGYFEKIKHFYFGSLPPERTLTLASLCIKSIEGVGCGIGTDLVCRVISDSKIWIYDLGKHDNCQLYWNKADDSIELTPQEIPVLQGDIKVIFFCSSKNAPRGYDDCLFYFWFHTSFIEDKTLWLPRDELDNPHKKKTWNTFKDQFGVKLLFA